MAIALSKKVQALRYPVAGVPEMAYEALDVRSMRHVSTEHVCLPFKAMKRMTIDKDAHLADPHQVDVRSKRCLRTPIARPMPKASAPLPGCQGRAAARWSRR